MVDRAALEMRSTGNRTGGSNPSLSANPIKLIVCPCRRVSMFDQVFQHLSMLTVWRASVHVEPRRAYKCGLEHGQGCGLAAGPVTSKPDDQQADSASGAEPPGARLPL